jgi:hypothetical protein
MGAEVLIPLALAAASTGMQVYNERKTASRQDDSLAAQLRMNEENQRQADAKTRALVQQQAHSTDTAQKATELGNFTKAIQQNQGNATKPLQAVGNVSAAYKQAGSDAALGMSSNAGKIADLVSSIDAPYQQRRDDAKGIDDYKIGIDQIARKNAGDNFLAQMRLRGIRPNAWLSAGSSLLGGVANGLATKAGSGYDYDSSAPMGDYGGGLGTDAGLDAYNLYGLMPGYGYTGAGAPKAPGFTGSGY